MATVLVVEDEPIVRMDAAMTLEDEGSRSSSCDRRERPLRC
jgi:CheY-like chemotaxis protein